MLSGLCIMRACILLYSWQKPVELLWNRLNLMTLCNGYTTVLASIVQYQGNTHISVLCACTHSVNIFSAMIGMRVPASSSSTPTRCVSRNFTSPPTARTWIPYLADFHISNQNGLLEYNFRGQMILLWPNQQRQKHWRVKAENFELYTQYFPISFNFYCVLCVRFHNKYKYTIHKCKMGAHPLLALWAGEGY